MIREQIESALAFLVIMAFVIVGIVIGQAVGCSG